MAVPDTNTFNLRNVTDEFGLENGDGLIDCFNDASSGSFDSSHNPNSDGTNNNLLNFRNYGNNPWTLNPNWTLADLDKDGCLDRDEFALCMFLMEEVAGGGAIPTELAKNYIPPSKRNTGPSF
jgi:hypothetical protein